MWIRCVALFCILLAAPAHAQSDQGADRPNIIFILSDDHRYDFMSFMNAPGTPDFLQTPNLDRMAAEGVHLANAFVTTSLCSPSRATILTGRYAHNHGVVDNQHLVPEGTRFFPQDLQEAGYKTAFIGKWHMGHASAEPRPGFDHWISFRGQGQYFNPTLNINGEEVEREGYTTDILTDYALEWLREQEGSDQPYFLYLSFKAVHHNFSPPERYAGLYAGEEIDYPATYADTDETYAGKPDWVREQRNSFHGVDFTFHGNLPFEEVYRRYAETLVAMDENIGNVLDYLDTSGQASQTLTMYMGDNGFFMGEHGLIDKRSAYEESIRVPLLAYAPGRFAAGTTVTDMVQNTDIAPTLLSAAGVFPPDHMDGRSFLPLLEGEDVPWRDEIFYEYFWERQFPQQPTMFSVRTDRYKYIYYHGVWATDELYDLQEDPQETRNLIDAEQHQELVAEMRERLFERIEAMGPITIEIRHPGGWWQAAGRREK